MRGRVVMMQAMDQLGLGHGLHSSDDASHGPAWSWSWVA